MKIRMGWKWEAGSGKLPTNVLNRPESSIVKQRDFLACLPLACLPKLLV